MGRGKGLGRGFRGLKTPWGWAVQVGSRKHAILEEGMRLRAERSEERGVLDWVGLQSTD